MSEGTEGTWIRSQPEDDKRFQRHTYINQGICSRKSQPLQVGESRESGQIGSVNGGNQNFDISAGGAGDGPSRHLEHDGQGWTPWSVALYHGSGETCPRYRHPFD